jgi:SAM-dependent methyltransferase
MSDMQGVTRRRPLAFDRVAADYDRTFTGTPLARLLREAVWSRLDGHVRPETRVLDIGCGTGEDAIWLAQRGARVVAADASPAMLEVTRQKARRAGVSDRIETLVLDVSSPLPRFAGEGQGVGVGVSNFGALNCIADLRPIALALAGWIQPGGYLLLVFLNRWCVWEIAWHVLHLQPRVAFRRLRRDGVDARIGEGLVRVWYPSIGSIRRVFAPAFQLQRVAGLGIWLPPSYLEPVVARRPCLFRWLARLERATASAFPFSHSADHVLLEFERAAR